MLEGSHGGGREKEALFLWFDPDFLYMVFYWLCNFSDPEAHKIHLAPLIRFQRFIVINL